jgi:hypothetical protein
VGFVPSFILFKSSNKHLSVSFERNPLGRRNDNGLKVLSANHNRAVLNFEFNAGSGLLRQ